MNNNTASRPLCESCAYFNEQVHFNGQDKGHGRCHRHPPTYTESSSGENIHHWQFPMVYIQNWCGDHLPANVAVKATEKNQ
jgi:hypothetical protein